MSVVTLPYPPSANRYWRHDRGVIHRSTEANEYIKAVGIMCLGFGIKPLVGNVSVILNFYRPAKRGDLDNSLKVILDSLRGFAYEDDSQIVEIHAMRHESKDDPRVEVSIQEAK